MTSGEFDIQQMRVFHLEFYHAFAQVFTDAVIEALSAAKQLEAPLGAQAKMAARFLLQINLLDELGFHPGEDNEGNYNGQPALAHYVQFFNTIQQLGMTEQEVKAWLPMSSSLACRATFENAYGDYTRLVGLLAVAETVFHDFATPWAKAWIKRRILTSHRAITAFMWKARRESPLKMVTLRMHGSCSVRQLRKTAIAKWNSTLICG